MDGPAFVSPALRESAPAPGPADAGFVVDVRWRADGAARVRVESQRRLQVARALIGRGADEALALVPLLFPLCGTAQHTAALTAMEAARGMVPAPGEQIRRTLLVLGEQAVSHVWRVVMDWGPLLGEGGGLEPLRQIRRAASGLNAALGPVNSSAPPDRAGVAAAVAPLSESLSIHLRGALPTARTLEALDQWARRGETVPARLIAAILESGLAGYGVHDLPLLGEIGADWAGGRLAADPGFGARPHLDGQPAESGALGRWRSHPLIQDIAARHGLGLLARFCAQILDGLDLPVRLNAAAAALPGGYGVTVAGRGGGTGCGVAHTSRGPLAHWVRLVDDQVADWRFVAPSEWNFHPDGPLARSIQSAPRPHDPDRALRLLVAAFDPCAPCQITVAGGADA